jgi:uncharacterized phage protein (TIGR02216 family)
MTPRELALAIEARLGRAAVPLTRTSLIEMMKRYPDGR